MTQLYSGAMIVAKVTNMSDFMENVAVWTELLTSLRKSSETTPVMHTRV